MGAEVSDAVRRALGPNRIVEPGQIVHRRVQFPAQFADIVHPKRADGHACDGDLAPRQPAERWVGQVGVGERRENLARSWPGDHQHAEIIGDVDDCHIRAGGGVQVVERLPFAARAGKQVEAVSGEPGDGPFALNPAASR